ncbi:hypothetical protein C8R46DRAFT_1354147 [Mycena filopes]|nr:hypothetical protein C8R46DRAFT_1354147 [Mycena filopes]
MRPNLVFFAPHALLHVSPQADNFAAGGSLRSSSWTSRAARWRLWTMAWTAIGFGPAVVSKGWNTQRKSIHPAHRPSSNPGPLKITYCVPCITCDRLVDCEHWVAILTCAECLAANDTNDVSALPTPPSSPVAAPIQLEAAPGNSDPTSDTRAIDVSVDGIQVDIRAPQAEKDVAAASATIYIQIDEIAASGSVAHKVYHFDGSQVVHEKS